jgi:hypothetical protein
MMILVIAQDLDLEILLKKGMIIEFSVFQPLDMILKNLKGKALLILM